MPSSPSAPNPPSKRLNTCAWTRVTTSNRLGKCSSVTATGRETLSGEAMGSGANSGLALEVPGHPGALREEGHELPGADQGGLHLAVVSAPASPIPFEIVCKWGCLERGIKHQPRLVL